MNNKDRCKFCGEKIDWDLCDPIIRHGVGSVILSCGHYGDSSETAPDFEVEKNE
jgi:hypothetical protein